MKFFNWMQNKFNGGNVQSNINTRKSAADTFPVPVPPTALHYDERSRENQPTEEDAGNFPHGLLTIGTLGSQQVPVEISPEEKTENIHEADVEALSQELAEFSPEEVGKLEKALKKLLKKKQRIEVNNNNNNANNELPLDRFLNCPSSLTVDRSVSSRYSTNSSSIITRYHDEEENIDRTIRVIIERCKQVSLENKKKGIFGKKSVSFLLKKMFVCSSGFHPAPSLRETMQESRMEKLLRTMMVSSKKMYPQNASRASSTKRILEGAPRFSIKRTAPDPDKKHVEQEEVHQEECDVKNNQTQDSKNDACKWVKTDSDYIVLDLD